MATQSTDMLQSVRAFLNGADQMRMLRVAADAEVSLRTVYNTVNESVDPKYSTVVKIYGAICALQQKQAANSKKK